MTENKRFRLSNEKDNETIFDNGEALGCIDVVELLNQLNDENKLLKSQSITHMERLDYEHLLNKSREENEQLKRDLEDCKKLIGALFDVVVGWDKSDKCFLKDMGKW